MTFAEVVNKAVGIAGTFIPIIIGIAIAYFLWGVSQFVLASGNEEKVAEGRKTMMWGIIAIFVMVSIWGLVALVTNTFNTRDGAVDTNYIDSLIK